jgi:hypothetical protein
MKHFIFAAAMIGTGCSGDVAGDSGPGGAEGDACASSSDCSPGFPVCDNGACTAACAGTDLASTFGTVPSDIIWIVDQSGSMDQETAYVQGKINDFVSIIGASNIDYRVVMIAAPGAQNAICVPAPLAGPSCGNNTRYRLVDQEVDSTDGPELALNRYPLYSDFLRPIAKKHFVFVTDDNSDLSAAQFTAGLHGLQPAGMFGDFTVHGIYAFGAGPEGCTGPFGAGAADGTVYTELIAQSGGASGVICTGNWDPVFTDITKSVVSGSQIPCELALPAPPPGEALDPNEAVVTYQGQSLAHVAGSASCTSAGGWYYDDNNMPTRITLCPSTCTSVQTDPMATVKVEFGCSTPIL